MEITRYSSGFLPRLHDRKEGTDTPSWTAGRLPVSREPVDLIEISPAARQLAAGAIDVKPAHLIGADKIDNWRKKPDGAPDDYINFTDLMKRFEPDTYERYRNAITAGVDEGLSILLAFAKKVPLHPDWVKAYREEARQAT